MVSDNLKKLPLDLDVDKRLGFLEKKGLELLKQLDSQLRKAPQKRLFLSLLVKEESYYSLKREHQFLSKKRFYLECAKKDDSLLNKNYKELVHYQKALFSCLKEKKISKNLIFKLHEEIKKENLGLGQKRFSYREKQNWIGKEGCSIEKAYFLPPKPHLVPPLMANLLYYLHHQNSHPLIQLGIGFAQFLIIHPFMDGNGRVARALVPFFLKEKKMIPYPVLFISSYIKKRKFDYFHKLYLITAHEEWNQWIEFFLKALILSTKQLILRIDELSKLYSQLIDLGINKRTVNKIFKQAILPLESLLEEVGTRKWNQLVNKRLVLKNKKRSLVVIRGLIPKILKL